MEQTILNWYGILGFPPEWKKAVVVKARGFKEEAEALFGGGLPPIRENKEKILGALGKKDDPLFNLLFFLYACRDLEENYREKDISRNLLIDVMRDLLLWAQVHYEITGEVGVSQISWLIRHVSFELFQLGRLQFQPAQAEENSETHNLKKGDPVLAVHIPGGRPMDPGACRESYRQAVEFFAAYFPGNKYRCFTCDTWFLDDVILEFLPKDSNIRKFREEYDVIRRVESDFALNYIFGFGPKEGIKKNPSMTDLQKKVLDHLEGSGKLYLCYGIRPLIV